MKTKIRVQLITALAMLMGVVASPAWALTHIEIQKLLASDSAAEDRFGTSVAMDGDTAVIGARDDDNNTGSVYVYTRSAGVWSEQQKLTASDGVAGDRFGRSVAMHGDTVVIGTSNESAYVFTRIAAVWTEQQKLIASDGEAFGNSVAVHGDTVVIGDISNDANGIINSGAAYVFTRSGVMWSEQQKLSASDGAELDGFGEEVAVYGDTVMIGAEADDSQTGSVYVFTRSGVVWSEQQKLITSDGASGDAFGSSIAMEGDTAAIGARSDDDNGLFSGSAYVFTRIAGVWSEQQKLLASDGEADDEFGISIAMDGDTAVIGTLLGTPSPDPMGFAYVFTRTVGVWTEQQILTASDGEADDFFGFSVAVSEETIVIGAPGDDDNGNASGSAYVFVPVIEVDIDIKPGNKQNVINPRSKGGIWVAILSDTDPVSPFDPTSQVDITTVQFGPDGAEAIRHKVKDVNKDGLDDLLLRFKIPETGIQCGDTDANLTGKTFGGDPISGTDAVKTVGCK